MKMFGLSSGLKESSKLLDLLLGIEELLLLATLVALPPDRFENVIQVVLEGSTHGPELWQLQIILKGLSI